MEKLKKLKLRDVKMMTDQEMKFITGGVGSGTGSGEGSGTGSGAGSKRICCRNPEGIDDCWKVFYSDTCDGHLAACSYGTYTCA